jgi:hypothetical protein
MPGHKDISIRAFRPSDLGVVEGLIHKTIEACCRSAYHKETVQYFKDWDGDSRIRGQK